jgi:hypothetical protein
MCVGSTPTQFCRHCLQNWIRPVKRHRVVQVPLRDFKVNRQSFDDFLPIFCSVLVFQFCPDNPLAYLPIRLHADVIDCLVSAPLSLFYQSADVSQQR